jgi:5'-3' exoribonuclease 1
MDGVCLTLRCCIDLDRIITQIVKPKVSVYMAIDGVAPRAKLNQQRSRRFRSAKDMFMTSTPPNESNEPGGVTQEPFDSNCITPGTEFLANVSVTIQYFIRKKIKEDPIWRNLLVIFSGPDVPGEGEHKIMSHIRAMRSDPNYQPNTRHCLYGQDADLVLLGLVTHEPQFTILREVVDFQYAKPQENSLQIVMKFTKESDFQLLHLSILREYLQIEFVNEQSRQYDLERILDDFVFMTFLVGNDFLPHIPSLDIREGALDTLFGIYKEQRENWGQNQYLTERGEVMNPTRLELFFMAIGLTETTTLEKREEAEAAYISKKRYWDSRDGKDEGPSDEMLRVQEEEKQNSYNNMLEDLLSMHSASSFVDGWTPIVETGRKDFKGRYYFEKLKLTPIDREGHWAIRRSYVEGLKWCLAYYCRGCISWDWFYPFHYGPMSSDLTDLSRLLENVSFDLGSPLLPFHQLMACLPPASSNFVPRSYRWLMLSSDSPISEFYPQDFDVDMNGKTYVLDFCDFRHLPLSYKCC